jgi:type VI secretion system secreted protein VgrG
VNSPKEHAMASFEFYEYPGEYIEKGHGDGLARLRIEELQTRHEVARGTTNDQELFSGAIFNLKECPMSDQNRGYLTTSTEIMITSDDFTSGGGGGGDLDFSCSFSVIPVAQRFRTARVTPKPMIGGPQTAIVVGPKGEEIFTDEHGRVKVQFHWDREGKSDQNSSKWIRCSSPWAGKGWGGIAIPRIGQEVIVEFLEGDPDRPIITGRVYNGEQTPPYVLPDNKTRSGMKTRSSAGGGADNFNEIRFEDKKGEEEVYVHAEKDFNCVIENCETRKVGYDDKDPGDQTIEVYNDRKLTVGNNETITIEKGDHTQKVSKGKTLNEAMQSIELKCGASSIKIEPSMITIKSPQIKVQGDAMVQVQAPMTKVTGSAVVQIEGGVVKIN